VFINDVVNETTGNEVVAGSDDRKIYTFSSSGNLIWDFVTESPVKTVTAGNLTNDAGNEVAGGATNGFLYTFNFDFFPTNVSLDAGNDGTTEWNSSFVKLRTTETATGFKSGIQTALSACTADANGACNIAFAFDSKGPGRLNITDLLITYYYLVSPEIASVEVNEWSRTSNILVNEEVGFPVKRVYFNRNPANTIFISYIDIPDSATRCDYEGSVNSTATLGSNTVCDIIPDFSVPDTGALPASKKIWDNTMSVGVPVSLSEGSPFNTTGINNFFWRKDLSVVNNTAVVFTNIIANTSIDDTVVRGNEFLNVSWFGLTCDITPASSASNCDGPSPSYTAVSCGPDTFSVCKKDRDSDGIIDFFKWVQPLMNSTINYQAGGSTNLAAILSANNVTPETGTWGEKFNFSIFVNDTENDNVNVILWLNVGGTWRKNESKIITGNGVAWFEIFSDRFWVGQNRYLFEHQDINSSGALVHSKRNTSEFLGPTVSKHNISVVHIEGDGAKVNRTQQPVLLVARINDTNIDQWVGSGVICTFWVTVDGINFDSGHKQFHRYFFVYL